MKKTGDNKILKPYEQYFADMLDHHHRQREGFLHLKLEEPRSYDYDRDQKLGRSTADAAVQVCPRETATGRDG